MTICKEKQRGEKYLCMNVSYQRAANLTEINFCVEYNFPLHKQSRPYLPQDVRNVV
jgi:hypothetical protein